MPLQIPFDGQHTAPYKPQNQQEQQYAANPTARYPDVVKLPPLWAQDSPATSTPKTCPIDGPQGGILGSSQEGFSLGSSQGSPQGGAQQSPQESPFRGPLEAPFGGIPERRYNLGPPAEAARGGGGEWNLRSQRTAPNLRGSGSGEYDSSGMMGLRQSMSGPAAAAAAPLGSSPAGDSMEFAKTPSVN